MDNLGQNGVISVVPPAALEARLQKQAEDKAAASQPQQSTPDITPLGGYIRGQYEIFRNHRNTAAGWSERLMIALRTFNGQYDATKLQEIKKFGGSEVYVRLIAQKCRAASSLLRDIYLSQDRPWAVRPSPDPSIPDSITQRIDQLMQMETQLVAQHTGKPPAPGDLDDRKRSLLESARDAAKKKAAKQARVAEDKIEEILRDGNFYHSLAEFLVDLPIFPFACIKGPVVKVQPKVSWPKGGGRPTVEQRPMLTWNRVSPFDLWWTPGVSDIENANVIERLRVTRAELNDLLDLPGYNQDEIRAVLTEYGRGGLYDNWDSTDSERAVLESRENPAWNRSGLIAMLEFNGCVQGEVLQEYGLAVEDPVRDYHIQAWLIGSHVIKCNLSPSPRQRHPYFITSFEKVPGTPVGNGLTDLLVDMQEVANSTMRALVNNMSIASGPQVVVDDDQLAPEENGEEMYPWKRWHVRREPTSAHNQQPVSFFMPTSNAQQLIAVFEKFVGIADDVSAIPKYIGGSGGGGAGRTASGLAMLMGNASKILQTVSANIDRDVLEQALMQLSDLILLTDTSGLLTGEENVTVLGVNVAIQRETIRQRQIEFLSATANPLDQKIVGMKGRGAILRSVASTIGMDGEQIVPAEEALEKMEKEHNDPQNQNAQAVKAAVDKGVNMGIEQGIKRIATELTAGVLAIEEQMPEGKPTHIGTPPGNSLDMSQNNPVDMNQAAAQAQGNKPGQQAGAGMAPQSATVVGNTPGADAMPISPGVG